MLNAPVSIRDRLEDLWGCSVLDRNDERIGSLQEVFYGAGDDEPEWLGIGIGLLGRKLVLVPADDVTAAGFALKLPFSSDFVQDAPELRHDDLDAHTLQMLQIYYGRMPHGAS
jgi:hypothetical protein